MSKCTNCGDETLDAYLADGCCGACAQMLGWDSASTAEQGKIRKPIDKARFYGSEVSNTIIKIGVGFLGVIPLAWHWYYSDWLGPEECSYSSRFKTISCWYPDSNIIGWFAEILLVYLCGSFIYVGFRFLPEARRRDAIALEQERKSKEESRRQYDARIEFENWRPPIKNHLNKIANQVCGWEVVWFLAAESQISLPMICRVIKRGEGIEWILGEELICSPYALGLLHHVADDHSSEQSIAGEITKKDARLVSIINDLMEQRDGGPCLVKCIIDELSARNEITRFADGERLIKKYAGKIWRYESYAEARLLPQSFLYRRLDAVKQ